MTPDVMSFGAEVEATSLSYGIGLLADMCCRCMPPLTLLQANKLSGKDNSFTLTPTGTA